MSVTDRLEDMAARAVESRPPLDELVAGAGGRIHLSKGLRLRRDVLAAMYPRPQRVEAERTRVDPDGLMRSDLGRRLGLCATGL